VRLSYVAFPSPLSYVLFPVYINLVILFDVGLRFWPSSSVVFLSIQEMHMKFRGFGLDWFNEDGKFQDGEEKDEYFKRKLNQFRATRCEGLTEYSRRICDYRRECQQCDVVDLLSNLEPLDNTVVSKVSHSMEDNGLEISKCCTQWRMKLARDVADAHIQAFQNPSASGRYCLVESVVYNYVLLGGHTYVIMYPVISGDQLHRGLVDRNECKISASKDYGVGGTWIFRMVGVHLLFKRSKELLPMHKYILHNEETFREAFIHAACPDPARFKD
ncbi:hypothetical protein Tco_0662089, partial [Tanacetum coccineum]